MKGKTHKLIGLITFIVFYYFRLFPQIINDYLTSFVNTIIAIIIFYLFSGGRIDSKNLLSWGIMIITRR